jgi:hypothetical protein
METRIGAHDVLEGDIILDMKSQTNMHTRNRFKFQDSSIVMRTKPDGLGACVVTQLEKGCKTSDLRQKTNHSKTFCQRSDLQH